MSLHLAIKQLKESANALAVEHPELADDPILRADMTEGCTNVNDVAEMLLEQLRESEALAEAIGSRIKAMAERKKRVELRASSIRKVTQQLLEYLGLTKITLPEATLSITYYGPKPIVADESRLPDEVIRIKREPDMTIIKDWVRAGNIPDGIVMSNGFTSLTVRKT